MNREILVLADWDKLNGIRLMGTLRASEVRGKEHFSFNYDLEWLKSGHAQALDPALHLFGGPQHLAGDRSNFGLFLDSSPDRWGRVLMTRREAAQARRENRAARRLMESDFLLGVHDEQRMGALRFQVEGDSTFLAHPAEMAAPPWATLRELENASWQAQDDHLDATEASKWIQMLMAPGSSLGGARPKAGVKDPNGDLWIAKFPGRNDSRDVGAWEWVVWNLAVKAGLRMATSKILELSHRHRTFATLRFDRVSGSDGRKRIHFASAMTLLGYHDGDNHHSGVSYLELCEFISHHGARVGEDLEEMWKRMVFSICISNTDDHLRNHGFLLTERGWVLTPAYDVNAEPDGINTGLSLNITESDNRLDLDLALEVAEYFRIKRKKAEESIASIQEAVRNWKTVATETGISRGEIEMMEPAFSVVAIPPRPSG